MSKIIYETRLTTEIILMCIIMKDSPCQSNRQLGCKFKTYPSEVIKLWKIKVKKHFLDIHVAC